VSKIIGHKYEQLAYEYLLNQQLKFISNNFTCKCGEIDLIMLDKDKYGNTNTLVFIEVRYRKNNFYGHPIETVTRTKQTKLVRSALLFIKNNAQYKNHPIRFDAIAILGKSVSKSVEITKNYAKICDRIVEQAQAQIEWYKNIITDHELWTP